MKLKTIMENEQELHENTFSGGTGEKHQDMTPDYPFNSLDKELNKLNLKSYKALANKN